MAILFMTLVILLMIVSLLSKLEDYKICQYCESMNTSLIKLFIQEKLFNKITKKYFFSKGWEETVKICNECGAVHFDETDDLFDGDLKEYIKYRSENGGYKVSLIKGAKR